MIEAEIRVRAFLEFWEENFERFAIDPATDHCDPPHPFDDDPDVLIAEYQPEVHYLRASDIRAVLRELSELRYLHRTGDVWEG